MKFALPKLDARTVRKWGWLGYPVVVVVVLGISLYVIFGGDIQLWTKLQDGVRQIKEKQQLLTTLQAKVATLNAMNLGNLNTELKWLLGVMPVSEEVWVMVNELRLAANDSGAVLVDWRSEGVVVEGGSIGEGLVGTFKVTDIEGLNQLLQAIESKLPLMTVKKVSFSQDRTLVVVSGAGSPLTRGQLELTTPVAQESTTRVGSLKQALSGFSAIVESADASLVDVGPQIEAGGNPFE